MKSNGKGNIGGGYWTKTAVRLLTASALVATPGLLLATPAQAATTGRAQVSGQVVRFTDTDSTVNDITVNRLGNTFLIQDRVAIRAGAGCSHPTANDRTLVWCQAPNATSVVISVGGGNDRVTSNVGLRNVIYGGSGADRLQGGNRGDQLWGGSGRDHLYGQLGDDRIDGGSGDDVISGWRGADVLFGGTGDDRIFGENGDDELYGNAGSDRLDGGSGTNRLRGGAGGDHCVNGPDVAGC